MKLSLWSLCIIENSEIHFLKCCMYILLNRIHLPALIFFLFRSKKLQATLNNKMLRAIVHHVTCSTLWPQCVQKSSYLEAVAILATPFWKMEWLIWLQPLDNPLSFFNHIFALISVSNLRSTPLLILLFHISYMQGLKFSFTKHKVIQKIAKFADTLSLLKRS